MLSLVLLNDKLFILLFAFDLLFVLLKVISLFDILFILFKLLFKFELLLLIFDIFVFNEL